MADLALIRRAKVHEVRVFLTEKEHRHLFDGRAPGENIAIVYDGSAKTGLILYPATQVLAHRARGKAHQRGVSPIDRRLTNDTSLVSQVYLPAKPLGFAEQYRAGTAFKSTEDGAHRLVINGFPQSWFGDNVEVVARAVTVAKEPPKPTVAPAARPPRPGPEYVWDSITNTFVKPKPTHEPPRKPETPAPPAPSVMVRDNSADVTAEENATRTVYMQPHTEKSSLPAIGADRDTQVTALRRLLTLAADVNAEMRRLRGVVRLEVDRETGALNLLRIYRPGQVRLRD